MSVEVIPDGERIVGDYLRTHEDIEELGARVAGRTPKDGAQPWIRVTQLDAPDDGSAEVEHLIAYFFQLDCYAGKDAMDDHTGQAEASLLTRTARAALKAMPAASIVGVVVSEVAFTGQARIPDSDFEPARERFVLDATVRMHPRP